MKFRTKAIEGPKAGTDEWYRIRKDPENIVIGASEAAAACGVSPYNTPLGLYLEKRGEYDRNVSAEQRVKMGIKLEPVIIDLYQEETGAKVKTDLPMYYHETYPFVGATPDGVVDNKRKATEVGVECKSTSFRMISKTEGDMKKFGRSGTDEVPIDYFLQVQQQMAVLGWMRVDIPVLIDGCDFRVYQVQRDDQVIDQIIEAEKELVERIKSGDPPEPMCDHSSTKDLLREHYRFEDGTTVDLDQVAEAKVVAYEDVQSRVRELEKLKELLRNEIISVMGPNQYGCMSDGRKVTRMTFPDTQVSIDDCIDLMKRLGDVKRKGYERMFISGVKDVNEE